MYFASSGRGGAPEFLFAKIVPHLGRLFEKRPAAVACLADLGKKTAGAADVSGSNGAGEKAGRKLFAAAAGKSVPHVKKRLTLKQINISMRSNPVSERRRKCRKIRVFASCVQIRLPQGGFLCIVFNLT